MIEFFPSIVFADFLRTYATMPYFRRDIIFNVFWISVRHPTVGIVVFSDPQLVDIPSSLIWKPPLLNGIDLVIVSEIRFHYSAMRYIHPSDT